MDLPTVIIRPSQVWSSAKEPFEGFVEGMNSGIGIICGAMTGFIRSMYACEGAQIKFTPADYVINAAIASAWKRASTQHCEMLVYNCTDAETNPLEWRAALKLVHPYFLKYAPYEKLVWYPKMNFTSIYVWHMMCLFLFQLLPAMFFDFVLIVSGRKRIFTRLQIKVIKGMQVLYDFTGHNFNFETVKLQELFAGLEVEDQKTFYFDHVTFDWNNYFESAVQQGRRLILKDDESTMPKAQEKLKKFFYADLFVKGIFGVAVLMLLKKFVL